VKYSCGIFRDAVRRVSECKNAAAVSGFASSETTQMVVMLKTSLRMTPSMKTSTEMAYEQMSAAQRYERNLSRPTAPPRNAPLEFEEYALTWSDKVALVPRMRSVIGVESARCREALAAAAHFG